MNYDTLFNVTCIIAALGWIVLLFLSPFWFKWDQFVVGIVIVILALTYSMLNFTHFDPDILTKFSTLDGVQSLYQDKALLLAGWEHFLAMDLLAAVWIKKNAVKLGIGHMATLPAIIFSCLLGPLGFVIYLVTRWIRTSQYFADNAS